MWVEKLHKLDFPLNDHCPPFCSDPACGVSPAEKLSPEHLQLLRNAFTCPKDGLQMHENRLSVRNKGGNEEHGMKLEEFREVLRSVVGPDIEDTWVERFFSEVRRNNMSLWKYRQNRKTHCRPLYNIIQHIPSALSHCAIKNILGGLPEDDVCDDCGTGNCFHIKVDISCTGQVKWQQLCSYLHLEYTERERASIPRAALLDSQPQIRHCSHNKVGSTSPHQVHWEGQVHLHGMLQTAPTLCLPALGQEIQS